MIVRREAYNEARIYKEQDKVFLFTYGNHVGWDEHKKWLFRDSIKFPSGETELLKPYWLNQNKDIDKLKEIDNAFNNGEIESILLGDILKLRLITINKYLYINRATMFYPDEYFELAWKLTEFKNELFSRRREEWKNKEIANNDDLVINQYLGKTPKEFADNILINCIPVLEHWETKHNSYEFTDKLEEILKFYYS